MKHCLRTLSVICLLLLLGCGDSEPEQKHKAAREPVPEPQAGILSAVPGDAVGFAAVKNPQEIVDRFKALMPALEELGEPLEDPLGPIRELLGDVDLAGPAAVVTLDLEDFDEEEPPVAFLVSAADAEAVVASHKETASEGETDLPEGVVRVSAKKEAGRDLYLAVKDDFVAVAFRPELAARVSNSQGAFEVLPEVRQAYGKNKIVALADLQRMRPWLIEKLNEARSEGLAEIDEEDKQSKASNSEKAIERDLGLLLLEIVKSQVKQLDKLVYMLEVGERGILYSQRLRFEAGSSAARFINDNLGKGEPSYESIPAGTFLLAGAKIAPEQLDVLVDGIERRAAHYPSLRKELNQGTSKLISDIKSTYRQFSGMAFTAGMGSPSAEMVNFVGRFDVVDANKFKAQIKDMCQGRLAEKLVESSGLALVYTDAAENYAGVDIDTIRVEVSGSEVTESEADAAEIGRKVMGALPMVIGPDMSIRIAAPTDDQALIIIGGGVCPGRASNQCG